MAIAPPTIEAGATYTLTAPWSTTQLDPGAYTVRAALQGPGVENIPTGIQVTP